jgi:nucleoside-diphosphate kinase
MQRGLAGTILSRLEQRGLKIVGLRLVQIDDALARRHYAEHEGKPFLEGLIQFITASPVVAAVFEGPNAVSVVRASMGPTDPQAAAPGTVRGDYGLFIQYNMIHGSDSPESARREIALFFQDKDLVDWERDVDRWIVE